MKMFSLIFMILAVASAEVILDGACPTAQPVPNFDMEAYAGTWYHIMKIPLPQEGSGDCETALYIPKHGSLKFKYTRVLRGAEVYVVGVARKAIDANNSAKLVLDVKIDNFTRVEPLWIAATDYENYAVSYSCKYDEVSNTHKLNVWVLSRTKGLEGKAKVAVDTFINKNFPGVASKFTLVDLSEDSCRIQSSRMYTWGSEL